MEHKIVERYFFFGLLLAALVFTLVVFRPFLPVLIIGASLSVVLHPVFEWLNKHVTGERSWLSSLITIMMFIIVLAVPLYFIGSSVFKQSQEVYTSIANGGAGNFIQTLSQKISTVVSESFVVDVDQKVADLITFVTSNIASIFTSTLSTILSFLLVLLAMFYFLKDGAHWRHIIVRLSPLSDADDSKILSRLSKAVSGVLKGYLLIALSQGILMGIGLWVFGVPHPALWAVLAAIASLVPSIGTALVAAPAILFLFLTAGTAPALGLLIWSLILVGTVDNMLNPILVGKETSIHPLLILFSVLGGIVLMGPVGLLIGPLAISLLLALVSIYQEKKTQHQA